MGRAVRIALSLAALLPLAGTATAWQGGYLTEEHPELGLNFPMARDYQPVPVQPGEEWVALYYAEKFPKDPKKARKSQPELSFVYIDFVSDRPPMTRANSDSDEDGPPPPPGEEADEGDEPEEPPPEPKRPVSTFERWMEDVFRSGELSNARPGKERRGYRGTEYDMRVTRNSAGRVGWAYVWVKDKVRTVALIGVCHQADFEEQSRIWRYIAERTEIEDPEGRSLEKIERYYQSKNLLDIPYRIEVRSKLVRGWKADDTENYIIIYSTRDEPLIRLIKTELEAMREEYEKLFPPVQPVKAVSTVRVCRDQGEYLLYGGPPGSGGYWNSQAQELVFFDYANKGGKANTGKADSRIVLYHEAFHQYIHYSCGELAPHSWFNEGTGDYFSGAKIAAGKVARIGVSPWRIGFIQWVLENEPQLLPPWREIIGFEQPEYYRPGRIGINYAMGWSMVYFLLTAPAVKKRPHWDGIHRAYFEGLKAAFARELEALRAEGKSVTGKVKAEAAKRAREDALRKAFDGVDLDELEAAWKSYTLSLKGK